MAIESPPWALQAGSYTAEQTRRAVFAWAARTAANSPGIIAGGLLSASDCQLSAPASGLTVNASPGEMLIGGTEGGTQGGTYARISSTTNLSISAASSSNPRIDLVCATVNDAQYTAPPGGVTVGQWAPIVVTGTPTSGATLSNLSGAPALPGSSLLLGYVLVPKSATNIVTADIANVASVASASTAATAETALTVGKLGTITRYNIVASWAGIGLSGTSGWQGPEGGSSYTVSSSDGTWTAVSGRGWTVPAPGTYLICTSLLSAASGDQLGTAVAHNGTITPYQNVSSLTTTMTAVTAAGLVTCASGDTIGQFIAFDSGGTPSGTLGFSAVMVSA